MKFAFLFLALLSGLLAFNYPSDCPTDSDIIKDLIETSLEISLLDFDLARIPYVNPYTRTLDLSDLDMTGKPLPETFYCLSIFNTIIIQNNKNIKVDLSKIDKIHNLRVLNLRGTKSFGALPSTVPEGLKELDLTGTEVQTVPSAYFKLNSLSLANTCYNDKIHIGTNVDIECSLYHRLNPFTVDQDVSCPEVYGPLPALCNTIDDSLNSTLSDEACHFCTFLTDLNKALCVYNTTFDLIDKTPRDYVNCEQNRGVVLLNCDSYCSVLSKEPRMVDCSCKNCGMSCYPSKWKPNLAPSCSTDRLGCINKGGIPVEECPQFCAFTGASEVATVCESATQLFNNDFCSIPSGSGFEIRTSAVRTLCDFYGGSVTKTCQGTPLPKIDKPYVISNETCYQCFDNRKRYFCVPGPDFIGGAVGYGVGDAYAATECISQKGWLMTNDVSSSCLDNLNCYSPTDLPFWQLLKIKEEQCNLCNLYTSIYSTGVCVYPDGDLVGMATNMTKLECEDFNGYWYTSCNTFCPVPTIPNHAPETCDQCKGCMSIFALNNRGEFECAADEELDNLILNKGFVAIASCGVLNECSVDIVDPCVSCTAKKYTYFDPHSGVCLDYRQIDTATTHYADLKCSRPDCLGEISCNKDPIQYFIDLYKATGGLEGKWIREDKWYDAYMGRITDYCALEGVDCKEKSLILPNNGLVGSLPDSIACLPIQKLNLSSNALTNSIPDSLGYATLFKIIDFSKNRLLSRIPPTLGKLTNLQVFDVSYNKLTSVVPPGFGNNVYLRHFSVKGNCIEGEIPTEMLSLTRLERFDVSCTGMTESSTFTLQALRNQLGYTNQVEAEDAVPPLDIGCRPVCRVTNPDHDLNNLRCEYPSMNDDQCLDCRTHANYFNGYCWNIDTQNGNINEGICRDTLLNVPGDCEKPGRCRYSLSPSITISREADLAACSITTTAQFYCAQLTTTKLNDIVGQNYAFNPTTIAHCIENGGWPARLSGEQCRSVRRILNKAQCDQFYVAGETKNAAFCVANNPYLVTDNQGCVDSTNHFTTLNYPVSYPVSRLVRYTEFETLCDKKSSEVSMSESDCSKCHLAVAAGLTACFINDKVSINYNEQDAASCNSRGGTILSYCSCSKPSADACEFCMSATEAGLNVCMENLKTVTTEMAITNAACTAASGIWTNNCNAWCEGRTIPNFALTNLDYSASHQCKKGRYNLMCKKTDVATCILDDSDLAKCVSAGSRVRSVPSTVPSTDTLSSSTCGNVRSWYHENDLGVSCVNGGSVSNSIPCSGTTTTFLDLFRQYQCLHPEFPTVTSDVCATVSDAVMTGQYVQGSAPQKTCPAKILSDPTSATTGCSVLPSASLFTINGDAFRQAFVEKANIPGAIVSYLNPSCSSDAPSWLSCRNCHVATHTGKQFCWTKQSYPFTFWSGWTIQENANTECSLKGGVVSDKCDQCKYYYGPVTASSCDTIMRCKTLMCVENGKVTCHSGTPEGCLNRGAYLIEPKALMDQYGLQCVHPDL